MAKSKDISYQIVTKKAVKGWCDPKQRVFSSYDTNSAAHRYAKAKHGLGLKAGEYTVEPFFYHEGTR